MKTWDNVLKYGFNVPYLKVGTDDGHNCFLLEGFTYTARNGEVVNIAPDFGTDGASTPSTMWTILPPFGSYWMACVLHDCCYRYLLMPKERCDELLNEAMQLLGVRDSAIQTISHGVHIFGWNSFEEARIKRMKGDFDE